jgi:hypothetical protein
MNLNTDNDDNVDYTVTRRTRSTQKIAAWQVFALIIIAFMLIFGIVIIANLNSSLVTLQQENIMLKATMEALQQTITSLPKSTP